MRNSFHSIFCFHAEFWLASRPRASGTRAVGLVGSSLRVSVRCLWHGSLLGWLWTRAPERAKGRCSQPECGQGPAVLRNGAFAHFFACRARDEKVRECATRILPQLRIQRQKRKSLDFLLYFRALFRGALTQPFARNRQARSHLPGRRACLRPRVRSLLGTACLRRTGGSGTRTRGPRQ